MTWDIFKSLFSIITMIIEVGTCLVVGFSFTGARLKENTRSILIISLIVGLAYYLCSLLIDSHVILLGIFLFLIPILNFALKLPLSQAIVTILLALLFDLMVIHLIEYNSFYLILNRSHESIDVGMNISYDLFVALNNIFISIIMYQKSPVLFSEIIFEKQKTGENSAAPFRIQLFFVIFILFSLNSGLFLVLLESNHLRPYFQVFLTIWSLVICVLFLFFLRSSISHKHDRIQLFLDQQYQNDLLSFYTIIRSQRHDFNFHLTAIHGLIQKREYASCNDYIAKMVKDAQEVNELLPLSHPSIAAMLSTFKELASKRGIQIHYDILDDLRYMPCSVYEMNKILGNLIQNALDEAGNPNNEYNSIEMEIKREYGNIVISVANPANISEEELHHIFQIGFSNKSAHEGLGLPTIQKIISKYHGVIYPELESGSIRFIAKIPVST
ncbi:sensor histidine kinase [Bacillus sp. B-jedd]|uniref:sensor histidine kinase n=1 Tax=Bacillus sp. B-jedd TaxID=1476857 RepID=UPI0005156201|nr:GHKL domain-containing protein [Bacillus sp. B-jedd]CEG29393.1 signal transduction histidine kinase regulating citrate/malate metabolism [Bacillus sp. B-jedd]